ncbi:glycosyltransferase [Nocardioides aurantiacus]|uniref:Polysaccharide deacetylase n=1 Tax=Nocardioides aurantiacus TaxID=86796 RepID=A0A3N2CRF8_9ACTN|nr:glycosyltransferase [Nocardioides aurantiacus]ROR90132.1 polysaccharide deacetylase [Nocardioides aurantiacus]
MSDGEPAHAVVIPTFQRRESVVAAVQALASQTVAPHEVVVVVDGSDDGTAEALRGLDTPFPLQVVEQTNAGASRARNHGAEVSSAPLLLFLDDDMLAAPDLLEVLRRRHAAGADAVLGHIPVAPASPPGFLLTGLDEWAQRRRDRLAAEGARLTAADLLTGQLSVRRAVFEELGGFDETFTAGGTFGNEDTDFGRRLFAGRHRIVFDADAVSHQLYTVTPRAYLRQWHQCGAADVAYVRKHPDDLEEIFGAKRPGTRSNRYVMRPLARVPVVRDLAAAGLRSVALALAARQPEGELARTVFFKARNLEYWRGVAEGGGMPVARGLRVLCYHAVADLRAAPPLRQYGVPPALLRSQLRVLRRTGHRFVTPDEAVRALTGGGGLPRRAVLVTFDDCFSDLVSAGLPVLQEERVRAVAFAVADRVGDSNRWDQEIGAPPLALLDAGGLARLQHAGTEIGAHASTHRPLTSVSHDPADLRREVAGSVETLEQLGLRRPRMFAYPHGENDAPTREAVAAAGLELAFTVTPGIAVPSDELTAVPRIEVLRRDGAGLLFLAKVGSGGRLRMDELPAHARRVRRRLSRVRHRLRQGAQTR